MKLCKDLTRICPLVFLCCGSAASLFMIAMITNTKSKITPTKSTPKKAFRISGESMKCDKISSLLPSILTVSMPASLQNISRIKSRR